MGSPDESVILADMNACRSRIASAERSLAEATRRRDDIDEFSRRFASRTDAIMADLAERQQKLSGAGIDESRVRFFATYRSVMQDAVNQARGHADQLHHRQAVIRAALDRAEDDISRHRDEIRREQNELTRLTERLRAARAAALAEVV